MGQSVLLVDDDADVRALLGEFLTEHGFVVHAARDGRHALRGIPVVILSAWNRQWAGARLDAVEVLSKPVDLNRLLKSACDRAPSIRSAARRADVKGLQLGVINRAQNNRGILKVLPLMNAHF